MIEVTGGTLEGFSGSGSTYSGYFVPLSNFSGEGSVSLASGVFSDTAGNSGVGANIAFDIDTVSPTAYISLTKDRLIEGEYSLLTIEFSEAIDAATFDQADLTSSGGTLVDTEEGLGLSGDGLTYTAKFTPDSGMEDDILIVLGSDWSDSAGNLAEVEQSEISLTIDTQAPILNITSDKPTDYKFTLGDDAIITFTFSEAVKNFSASDVTVSGGKLKLFRQSDEEGREFKATFVPEQGISGSASISVSTEWSDKLGNSATAGNYLILVQ